MFIVLRVTILSSGQMIFTQNWICKIGWKKKKIILTIPVVINKDLQQDLFGF